MRKNPEKKYSKLLNFRKNSNFNRILVKFAISNFFGNGRRNFKQTFL